MVITYYGLSCFKVQSGDLTIAFDPPSKESDMRPPRFETHIALSSHDHPRHNGLKELSGKKGEKRFIASSRSPKATAAPAVEAGENPLFISGPGEYEIEGVSVIGFPSWHDREKGKTLGANTIYRVTMEGINLCHLGDIGAEEIESDTVEGLGEIDVLFIPIGGKDVVGPDAAAKITGRLDPKVAIPMHYAEDKLKEFLKELGEERLKAEEKFTFKKKELPESGLKVVVLTPASLAESRRAIG